DRPQRVTSNNRLGIVLDSLTQSRNRGGRSNIRGYDRGVAKKPSSFWTRQRSAAESMAKLFVACNRKHFDQIESRSCAGRRFELGPSSFVGERIERAHVLTHVATEDPFTDSGSHLSLNCALVLNSQIRNASIRIQLIRRNERIRRARIDAPATGPATDFYFLCVRGEVE